MRRLRRHYAYFISVRLKMPKPGYATIVVKESVRSHLQKLAKAQGYRSINQLLEAWLVVYPRVNPTSTNREIRHPEIGLKQAPFQKGNSEFWWTGGDLNPRPPECKSGVHSRLNYRPSTANICPNGFPSPNTYLFK